MSDTPDPTVPVPGRDPKDALIDSLQRTVNDQIEIIRNLQDGTVVAVDPAGVTGRVLSGDVPDDPRSPRSSSVNIMLDPGLHHDQLIGRKVRIIPC